MKGNPETLLLVVIAVLAVAGGLFVVHSAFAKGGFDKVVILDLQTGRSVESSDPVLVQSVLWDPQSPTSQPAEIQRGYVLVRYAISHLDGKSYVPVDIVHFYSGTGSYGTRGYVYYVGWPTVYTEFDRKWFAAAAGVRQAITGAFAQGSTSTLLTPALALAGLAFIVGAFRIAHARSARVSGVGHSTP